MVNDGAGTGVRAKGVDEARCPLCDGANACAMADGPTHAGDCWCVDVRFDAASIARVPARLRGVACLCAACAVAPPGGR